MASFLGFRPLAASRNSSLTPQGPRKAERSCCTRWSTMESRCPIVSLKTDACCFGSPRSNPIHDPEGSTITTREKELTGEKPQRTTVRRPSRKQCRSSHLDPEQSALGTDDKSSLFDDTDKRRAISCGGHLRIGRESPLAATRLSRDQVWRRLDQSISRLCQCRT